MKSAKILFFYIMVIGAFSLLIYWIAFHGATLEAGRQVAVPRQGENHWFQFTEAVSQNLTHPLAILLAQILSVVVVARIFGWICKKIRQPTVIGEILAGIALGPSFMGMYYPGFSEALFPAQSMGILQFLSQIGLIMFMFVVGMELELKELRNRAHEAIVISHASIVIPFALGMGLSYFIYEAFAPEHVTFLSFGLFMGIAMSITAFPVLARIVQERGIYKTRLGSVVITCAAADDITAWCILAAVIAIAKAGSFISSLYVILLAVAYVFFMVKLVRPFLTRVGDLHISQENLSKPVVAIFFITLILSSYVTEIIGIHALFGAFMAGAIMPENPKFRSLFIEKIEDVSLVLLLPLFFVFTGLRTQIGLLDDPYLWKVTFYVILVAVAGKFAGSALAAKYVGQSWKDSLTIGALMNTRGLMELVVLNIGYDLGVMTAEIFSIMVIMALITTIMTGPVLDAINWSSKTRSATTPHGEVAAGKYRILISFANPHSGKTLLHLANGLIGRLNPDAIVTAMHLSPVNELHHYNMEEYERESFAPVLQESQRLSQKTITLFKASNNIEEDIAAVAGNGDYDLLLMGFGQSMYEGSLLGKVFRFTNTLTNPGKLFNRFTGRNRSDYSPFDERTRLIVSNSPIPVGVLVAKNFEKVQRVFIAFGSGDLFLIRYLQKFAHNGVDMRIATVGVAAEDIAIMKQRIGEIEAIAPGRIAFMETDMPDKAWLHAQDLMVVSVTTWKTLLDSGSKWLSDGPSTLILTDK